MDPWAWLCLGPIVRSPICQEPNLNLSYAFNRSCKLFPEQGPRLTWKLFGWGSWLALPLWCINYQETTSEAAYLIGWSYPSTKYQALVKTQSWKVAWTVVSLLNSISFLYIIGGLCNFLKLSCPILSWRATLGSSSHRNLYAEVVNTGIFPTGESSWSDPKLLEASSKLTSLFNLGCVCPGIPYQNWTSSLTGNLSQNIWDRISIFCNERETLWFCWQLIQNRKICFNYIICFQDTSDSR